MTTTAAPERLKCSLLGIEYRDAESGYSVLSVVDNDDRAIKAVGTLTSELQAHEELSLTGQWATTPQHLPIFEFDTHLSRPPKDRERFLSYLSIASMVSTVKINALMDHFGEQLISVLDYSPERLGESGISERECEQIREAWTKLTGDTTVPNTLQELGIEPYTIECLRRLYGKEADIEALLKNDPFLPYLFVKETKLQQCIALAKRYSFNLDSVEFYRALIVGTLRQAYTQGEAILLGRKEIHKRIQAGLGRTISPEDLNFVKALTTLPKSIVSGREMCYLLTEVDHFIQHIEQRLAGRKLVSPDQPLSSSKPYIAKLISPVIDPEHTEQISDFIHQVATQSTTIGTADAATSIEYIKAIHQICKLSDINFQVIAADVGAVEDLLNHIPDLPCSTWQSALATDSQGLPSACLNMPLDDGIYVIYRAHLFGVPEMSYLLNAIEPSTRIVFMGAPYNHIGRRPGHPFIDYIAKTMEKISCDLGGSTEFSALLNHQFPVRPDYNDLSTRISLFEVQDEDASEMAAFMIEQLTEWMGYAEPDDFLVTTLSMDPANKDSSRAFVGKVNERFREKLKDSDQPKMQCFVTGAPLSPTIPPLTRGIASLEQNSIEVLGKTYPLPEGASLQPGFALSTKLIAGTRVKVCICYVPKRDGHQIDHEHLFNLLEATTDHLIFYGDIADLWEPTEVHSE